MTRYLLCPAIGAALAYFTVFVLLICGMDSNRSPDERGEFPGRGSFDDAIRAQSGILLEEGRETFRNETFGNQSFWGDALKLHTALAGLSPRTALAAGLKVDMDALPADLIAKIKKDEVLLDNPGTTVALLRFNSVLGVRGAFDKIGTLTSVGFTCALCHSTVDDSFRPGIGRRLDGWANRDLDIGKIVSLAPNLQPLSDLLQVDAAAVRSVLGSWGPGRYDALPDKDGKAATLIPPVFGLAGVNLRPFTELGSIPYWNACVGATRMPGSGTVADDRLKDPRQVPGAARTNSWNAWKAPDRIGGNLPALHYYQLSIPSPRPPSGSFDRVIAGRGRALFEGRARCATCHVAPQFTEQGHNRHGPAGIGIDAFPSDRSPTMSSRPTPLRGLWSHQKGGFYRDGRFATLLDVVNHYDLLLKLGMAESEKTDLIQFLLSH